MATKRLTRSYGIRVWSDDTVNQVEDYEEDDYNTDSPDTASPNEESETDDAEWRR